MHTAADMQAKHQSMLGEGSPALRAAGQPVTEVSTTSAHRCVRARGTGACVRVATRGGRLEGVGFVAIAGVGQVVFVVPRGGGHGGSAPRDEGFHSEIMTHQQQQWQR